MWTILSTKNQAIQHVYTEPSSGNYIRGRRTLGMFWDGSRMVSTVEDFSKQQKSMYVEVINLYSKTMKPLSSGYSPEEREGWAEQITAANEVINGSQNDLVDTLRIPTGETALEMAGKILALRNQYLLVYGQVTAARRALDSQISTATTVADLKAIDIKAGFGLT